MVYTVHALADDQTLLEAWLAWIPRHAAEVVAAGARSAEVARLDGGPPWRVECRYRFDSREAFAAYEREHAPRLRAAGLAAFPSGIRLSRSFAELVLDLTTR